MSDRNGQSGAVLICALAMVAAMSVTALAVLDGMRLAIRSSVHLETRQRARYYADAAILAARHSLTEAARRNNVASLVKTSDASVVKLSFIDGAVQTRFRDGSQCFNLNSLRVQEGQAFDLASGILAALLENMDQDPQIAHWQAASLADWMDADNISRKSGAEDIYYSIWVLPPYRTSGQELADVSELRRVAGFEPIILQALETLVCTRPGAVIYPLNINALAVEHAPLLAAFCGESLSVHRAKNLILKRPAGGYARIEDFLAEPEFPSICAADEGQEELFSVQTRWVDVDILVQVQETEMAVTASLEIGSDKVVNEISRKFGA